MFRKWGKVKGTKVMLVMFNQPLSHCGLFQFGQKYVLHPLSSILRDLETKWSRSVNSLIGKRKTTLLDSLLW